MLINKTLINKIQEKIFSFCKNPEKIFLFSVALAFVCAVVSTAFLKDIYTDTASVYARFAREIGNGNWTGGIVTRVPMLNIVLGGLLSMIGMETAAALTLVAGLFYCLTCFPLRCLLERYLSPLQAAWGCFLYVTAPKMIRFSCAPLLESSRIFFLISALFLFFESAEKKSWKKAILFGISSGFLMVSRGECFFVGVVMLMGLFPYMLLFQRKGIVRNGIFCVLLSFLFAVVAVAPFCIMNHSKSGYYITDMRVVEMTIGKKEIPAKEKVSAEDPRLKIPAGAKLPLQKFDISPGKVITCIFRGGYELYWIFAVIGICLLFRNNCWKKPDYLVFAGIAFMQCLMYAVLVSTYRYYIFLIPLFMFLTVSGMTWVLALLRKYLPQNFLILLPLIAAVVVAAEIRNGISRIFSESGTRHQAVGAWISDYAKRHNMRALLRVYNYHLPQIVYWSGCKFAGGYETKVPIQTFSDFDLMVVSRKNAKYFICRDDLDLLENTPHSDRIMVFKKKQNSILQPEK